MTIWVDRSFLSRDILGYLLSIVMMPIGILGHLPYLRQLASLAYNRLQLIQASLQLIMREVHKNMYISGYRLPNFLDFPQFSSLNRSGLMKIEYSFNH